MWERSRRVTLSSPIGIDHICASAAIPLVFQPVRLPTPEGVSYFGDGCLRLQQPLSPVIRLGAKRILAVGVRGQNLENAVEKSETREPSLGEVLGVLLNVMFVDHLVQDIEHLQRLNRLLGEGALKQPLLAGDEKMRPLKCLLIAPSVDLSELAAQHQGDMPYLIHYFVSSLGREAASCSDLMSYLLFTPKYTRALVEIGYEDASRRIDEIEDLLYPAGVDDRSPQRRRAPLLNGKSAVNGKSPVNGKSTRVA
jgi:NTE family protein